MQQQRRSLSVELNPLQNWSDKMRYHLLISIVVFGLTYFFCEPSKPVVQDQRDPVEEVEREPVKTALIEMQLADWCGPCRRFKASGAIKELEKNGWTIKYTDGISSSYPSFRVWVDGKSETFSGYSSKSSFFKRLKSIIKKLK